VQTENEKAVRDPMRGAFLSWWHASKYMQVVFSSDSTRQVAWDGWQAALQSQVSNTDGWVRVPVEPTSDQVNDGADAMRQAMAMFNRGRSVQTAARRVYEAMLSAAPKASQQVSNTPQDEFQQRVQPWMMACFGPEISADTVERNHRFLEEALELVQACGCTQSEAHQLVDYVYGRPVGEKHQEVGGVMVTLAALCLAQGLNMHEAGEAELARIWTKVEKIRAKQAAKPKHSPLPEHVPIPPQQQSEEAIPPELDVRNIMLRVVPGLDGMGEEVFARSVDDVVRELSLLGSQLEDYELGIRKSPATPTATASQEPSGEAVSAADAFELGFQFANALRSPMSRETRHIARIMTADFWPAGFSECAKGIDYTGTASAAIVHVKRNIISKLSTFPATPTSTAIAAMVIKQAADIVVDRAHTPYAKNWDEVAETIRNLLPANAEAELVKLILKVINEAQEYTEEGIRRVLDGEGK
jgi:hypothetical protein